MLEEAVEHLDRSEPMIVDKLFYHEKKAALLIKLGREPPTASSACLLAS